MKVRELEARFPYMFEGPQVGLTHYRGWFPVFASLCVAVDAVLGVDKRGFRWTRIDCDDLWRARFDFALDSPEEPLPLGSRLPWAPDADLNWHFVLALVARAEEIASGACLVCAEGAEGFVFNDTLWKSCNKHRPPIGATEAQVDAFRRDLQQQWLAE